MRDCIGKYALYTNFGSVSSLPNAVGSYDGVNDHISWHTRRSANMNEKAAATAATTTT